MLHDAFHFARARRHDEFEARRVVEREQHAHGQHRLDLRSEFASPLALFHQRGERAPQAL